MALFFALFRMASFIMLPQCSPITLLLLDLITQATTWAVKVCYYVGYTTRNYVWKTYQAFEAIVASFIPWLVFATITSIMMSIGRFHNSMRYWVTILLKLWYLDSEHRSIIQIFLDPIRRRHLHRYKPGWKNIRGTTWVDKVNQRYFNYAFQDPLPVSYTHLTLPTTPYV